MNHIFVTYSDGFPVHYSAANTKISFLGKGLIELGDNVTLINKFYGVNNIAQKHGFYDGIEYYSFPSKVGKTCGSIVNTYKTIRLLNKLFKGNETNVVYIGCGNFFVLYFITLFARFWGYKVAFIFEEWQYGSKNTSLMYRINAFLHSKVLGYYSDYILPISEFLKSKSLKFKKPIFKLPICANFKINTVPYKRNNSERYLLYCASVGYKRAFEFIVDSFTIAFDKCNDIKLHLILSGDEKLIESDKLLITKRKLDRIVEIKTKLPYEELLTEYVNAQALLIPLFPDSITDVARFSQKISEYLTTGRPIISTKVGEVAFYFKNFHNMLISSEVTEKEYASLMKYTMENVEESEEIGRKGYELGKCTFDYRVLSLSLKEFIINHTIRNYQ